MPPVPLNKISSQETFQTSYCIEMLRVACALGVFEQENWPDSTPAMVCVAQAYSQPSSLRHAQSQVSNTQEPCASSSGVRGLHAKKSHIMYTPLTRLAEHKSFLLPAIWLRSMQ